MIAPLIIQGIFWFGSIVLILGGLVVAILSLSQIGRLGGTAWVGVLGGLGYMIVGPIALRVYCEVLIIFFRMYETMKEVRDGIDRMRKD